MPDPTHPPVSVESGGTLAQSPADAARILAAAGAGPPAVPGYELLGELGKGAMGVVYRARQAKLNRLVALKMILCGDRAGKEDVTRFLAEAEAVAAVRHPNVVQIYECGEVAGQPYMVLEFLSGGTLAERLAGAEPVTIRTRTHALKAAEVVTQIARGVGAAHALGIVHRDLKPGNVLFDEAGAAKVTDFGLAKRGGGSDLTAKGIVMGTPAYMSPEQACGNTKFVCPRADVWALGVILYEYLTGTRPFVACHVEGLLVQIMAVNVVPPREHSRSIPRELERICLKCLSKRPEERYPTATDLADDLGRFVGGASGGFKSRLSGIKRGWVKRRVYAVAAVVLLGAVVGAAAVAGAFSRPRGHAVAPDPTPPARYTAVSKYELFDGQHVRPWVAPFWSVQADEAEGTPALTGAGIATRPLPAFPHARVMLSLDPHEATTVDVILAVADGPPATAEQWLVRIDRAAGAVFGKRAGSGGAPAPLGAAAPVPTVQQLRRDELPPYLKLVYTRAGGTLGASFNGQPLGSAPDAGRHAAELRIEIKGGPIRIDEASVEELAEDK